VKAERKEKEKEKEKADIDYSQITQFRKKTPRYCAAQTVSVFDCSINSVA
jgi:hypothetical protein